MAPMNRLSLFWRANIELSAFYRQMDEILRKSEIPKEQGESDMIRMLDTARAIPNTPKMPTSHTFRPTQNLPKP